jgi:tripartite-type tricarboxylate transporter receptor subunit TctC
LILNAVKALVVGTKTRSLLVPEYPTVSESGVPGYESSTAFGVLAPTKTPAPVIGRLNRELVKILQSLDIKEKLAAQGLDTAGGTPRQYSQHLKDELAKYGRVVKAAGIKFD